VARLRKHQNIDSSGKVKWLIDELASVCQPWMLRMLVCPEASSTQATFNQTQRHDPSVPPERWMAYPIRFMAYPMMPDHVLLQCVENLIDFSILANGLPAPC
jgi:hypothetical protein